MTLLGISGRESPRQRRARIVLITHALRGRIFSLVENKGLAEHVS